MNNGFRNDNNNLHLYFLSKTKGVITHIQSFVFVNLKKNKLAQKKHKHTMNQFWFGDNQCQIFALFARFF